jgi:hypothetical protein
MHLVRAAVTTSRTGADEELERLRSRCASLERQNARLRRRVDVLRSKKEAATLRAEARDRVTALPEVPGQSRLEVRRANVLASSPADVVALEIGPAHNAILPKREGYRTRTVDYLDREGLIARYRDFDQYKPEDIEEVDYVLPPGSAMGQVIDERFGLVLASHVIEHTTSMIDFLNECEALIQDDGVVALVVPDHRYCFDRFRERSSLARVIDAATSPPPLHTVGAVTEERLNAVRHRGTSAWMPGHRGTYALENTISKVRSYAEDARSGSRYIDTHNWVCTPHHLRLLLQDLADLGYINLRECHFHDTVRHEFFINLRRGGPGTGLTREQLLVLAEAERISMDIPEFEVLRDDVPG